MKIEACIHCDTLPTMVHSVRAAYEGGASRLELCAAMDVDGLTPSREFIVAARQHFPRPGVLVMIRPRAGNFIYADAEREIMQEQMSMAAECGADGVVFGVLEESGNIDVTALATLMRHCQTLKLQTTFHRAFDATPSQCDALEILIDSGVDRVLTSGTTWGDGGGALDGITNLNELIERAAGRIEIVIGGGVSPKNAAEILRQLSLTNHRVSLHSYSGIRKNEVTETHLVRALVNVAAGLKT